MNRIIVSQSTNPWENLAFEERLFLLHEEEARRQATAVTLYLWQNERTVVIGRNQNAWKECRVAALEAEQGKLARRMSGGGAVYHDLGNLNFTFLLPRAAFDIRRQFAVIQQALGRLGVGSVLSGRNDLTLPDGGKFSGSAFRLTNEVGMHHGTLMVDVDMARMARFLMPSKEKLASKGADSVRARVRNLKWVRPALTLPALQAAVAEAFQAAYGPAQAVLPTALANDAMAGLYAKYASWEWRFGRTPRFDVTVSKRFSWGEAEVLLACQSGLVNGVTVYTDAMDETLAARIEGRLLGAAFTPAALFERLAGADERLREIGEWLSVTLASL